MSLKVLIHVNEPERWHITLNNITNMLKDDEGSSIETHVISNGRGVNGYVARNDEAVKSEIERMEELAKRGVKFFACNNALIAQKIDARELPAFVAVVASSMTEMVRRQAQGFAYIKP